MRNSIAVCLLALGIPALPAGAELLKLSLLQKPAPGFAVRRDLFAGPAAAASGPERTAAPAQAEALQRSIAEEIAQSISYEGFIVKNARPLALLSVSGEFFAVGEGESVLNKIKVLKIAQDAVTIEYDGQPYEIRIKGDANG